MSEPLTSKDLVVGGFYNWKGQPERLSYIGAQRYNGDSRTWHQFALVDVPGVCWCEVLDWQLNLFEVTERAAVQAAQPEAVGEPWGVDANKLLSNAMKPSEIAGPADVQRRRVSELLSWFARLADGQANPKWTTEHAFELAYYIASAPTPEPISAPTEAKPGQDAEDADSLAEFFALHAAELEDNPYAYCEVAYTRATGWMAWITDKPLCAVVVAPDRKVLTSGQGDTPAEAARAAISAKKDAPSRPSAEWYAAKIQETLDDDFTIGPPPTKEQP